MLCTALSDIPNSGEPCFIFGYDFYYQWVSGSIALNGGNFYDYQTLRSSLSLIGWPAWEEVQVVTRPPWNLWLYAAVGWMPPGTALWAWMAVMFLLIGVCVALLTSIRDLYPAALSTGLAAFAVCCFPGVIQNVVWAQSTIVPGAGLLLFLSLWRGRRDFLAGAALSLVFLKPHLLIPFLIGVAALSLKERRFGAGAGLLVGFAAQAGAALAISSRSYADYAASLPHTLADTKVLTGASIGQVLWSWTHLDWIRPAIFVAGILIALAVSVRSDFNLRRAVYQLLPLSLLTAPYVWGHDMIFLLPVYLGFVSLLDQRLSRAAPVVIALLGAIGAILSPLPYLAPLSALIPVLFLVLESRILPLGFFAETGRRPA